jgi:hypothetical protein
MSISVTCHRTHLSETLNAGRDRRHARSSHEPRELRPRPHRLRIKRTLEEGYERSRLGRRRATGRKHHP